MIDRESLRQAIVGLAAYSITMLCLLTWALVWMTRGGWRSLAGGGLLVALLVYGFLPSLVADVRSNRLAERMWAASFWPEELTFAGTTVVMISPFGRCSLLCETLFERGQVNAMYVVELSGEGLAFALTSDAIRDPATRVAQVGTSTTDAEYVRIDAQPAPLPAAVHWIIVEDPVGAHAQANPEVGLEPATVAVPTSTSHISDEERVILA